ncbi:MAG TPA: hypothetical protein VH877_02535 [Polyangia bacterium]|jgi:hypothetical protein|nr:hypothetical protein [Polyangia bacterium]
MNVRLTVDLPYLLLLPDGEYPLADGPSISLGWTLKLSQDLDITASYTQATTEFAVPDDLAREAQQARRLQEAKKFLGRLNQLLRWYRAASRRADIVELTLYRASPFSFFIAGTDVPWGEEVRFASRPSRDIPEGVTDAVRRGLVMGVEPDVADLFLLDAEEARHTGRFRETVLFCWSTIDAVFNREYDKLVDRALANEPKESRKFFKGLDFGLKNKMSAAMYLIAGRSLSREPDGLWEDLSESYAKRNSIIHRGDVANEDDATRAFRVASKVVEIMRAIAAQASQA